MITYQNKTRCPLSILAPLFEQAATAVGVDVSQPLKVKITQGRKLSHTITGLATNYTPAPEIKVLLPRKPLRAYLKGGHVLSADPLELAVHFWRVVAHEWGHVLDYQANAAGATLEFSYYKDFQKIRHDDRPQEIRADQYAAKAERECYEQVVPGYEDVVLALAIWFDEG